MTTVSEIRGDHTILEGYIPGQATAATTDEWVVGRVDRRCTVTAAYFVPVAGVTGDDTDNFIIDVRNRGAAGAGTADVATLEFATGTDGTAFAAVELTVSTSNDDLAVGDVITVEKRVTGLGLAMPEGTIVLVGRTR